MPKEVTDWYATNDPGSVAGTGWQGPEHDTSGWKTMILPTYWEAAGLPDFDGIVWFRDEITLPDAAAGKPALLSLGPVDDNDTTWVNGVRVGATEGHAVERRYKIPENVLRAGRNVIAVRVLDTGSGGGIYGKPEQMTLTLDGGTPVPLAGAWKYQVAADLKKTSAYPVSATNNPNVPTVLYNSMIAPLVPMAVKGAIWYQGESNAGRDVQYRRLLPALITDWRSRFGVGRFPFYIVQLAGYMPQDTEPRDDPWPRLREAQFLTTKALPNVGIATAIDIGDAGDIHPKNKQEVGRRLALDALALTYGKRVEYSGPIYKAMKIEGGVIRLSFDHRGGGLVSKGGTPLALKGFAVAGRDGKFVWATARVDRDTVLVSAPGVPAPVAVRYAWSNNPICDLYNKDGLPALPFRTDGPVALSVGE